MIAVVTGANRGLGFGVSEELAKKGHTVIMTARDPKFLEESQHKLRSQDLKVFGVTLDVSDHKSIQNALGKILSDFKGADILINNAGVSLDGLGKDLSGLSDAMLKCFSTNTVGPALLIQGLLPAMKKNNFGRIVNVSSGFGSLKRMGKGSLAYRTSKTAMNAITRVFAFECQDHDILINAVSPGWVKTRMGGSQATRELAEGVSSILWAAQLPSGGPNGGFFEDGREMDW